MGLFDKPEEGYDGKIRELVELPIFVQGFELRDVDTMYGPGTAIDLTILVNGERKVYSGFGAGILRQLKDSDPSEFPLWCKIQEKELRGNKSTLVLVPSSEAEAQQMTTDDDIPF
jgi:hypothetical protein